MKILTQYSFIYQIIFKTTLAFLLMLCLPLEAQAYGWTKTMGGTGIDLSYSVTTDAAGNVFISGSFAGTVDFDPSAGVDNHVSAGSNDIFLSKINADGSYGQGNRIKMNHDLRVMLPCNHYPTPL